MKYEAINELNHFQYHDAEINQINIQDNNMQWDVSYINATWIFFPALLPTLWE